MPTLILARALLAGVALLSLPPAVGAATPDPQVICDLITEAAGSGIDRATTAWDGGTANIAFRPRSSDWRLAVIDLADDTAMPVMQIRALPACNFTEARRLVRDDRGRPTEIEVLGSDLATVRARQPVNPPVPLLAAGTGTALLAHIDTGVNYLLPDIAPHLATDGDGRLLGFDFWDDDDRPYDTDPRRNAFFPMHHGTTTFSLLAREAPGIPIAAYRFPAPDLCRFEALIDHMDGLSVRVVSLSMGSSNREEWRCFAAAAERHPQMLFVVSAGNDGRDIDLAPVYPAALPLDNIVTVTSSDDFGRLGRGSNSGATSVDFMVPAERIEVTDHRGARADTGGTSYAAPRLAALAARYLSKNPDADSAAIISFLKRRARPAGDAALKYGWIPDPLDDYGF